MNLSKLITRIKTELGLYAIALPIDDLDGTIRTAIKEMTLRVYSQYFPQYEIVRKSASELDKAERNLEYTDLYLDVPDGTEILSIEDIYYDASDISGIGYYGAGMPLFEPNMIQDLLTTNIGANMSNMMFPKPTWEFFYPRKVRVYNLYGGSIFIKYAKLHDLSLSSIPFSQEETFTQLAILDVKKVLYNVVKHYNELETAHGRITLKIDDWAEAANERRDILNQWDDNYHLERKTIYYA